MKVLIINGSPRVGGNTSIALDEMVKGFESERRSRTWKVFRPCERLQET